MISQMEAERSGLKEELNKIEKKNRFLEAEIERENKPLGFDFGRKRSKDINFHNSSLQTVGTKLHEELIEFQGEVSSKIEEQESICTYICATLRTIVCSLSTDLDVR